MASSFLLPWSNIHTSPSAQIELPPLVASLAAEEGRGRAAEAEERWEADRAASAGDPG
ncbi:MAG: hypothetical protein H0U89_00515 [Acidimicrobiia bacterium]|nr:hypothetical protein [Acidimicrobiia bacterium]